MVPKSIRRDCAHSGESAAVAAAQQFTLGLIESFGGCCLGDDIPETAQVVHGLENILWVVEMQTEIHCWKFKAHTHTYIRVMLWEAGAKLV